MATRSRPRLVFLLTAAQRSLHAAIAAEQQRLAEAGSAPPSLPQVGLLFALSGEDGQTMGTLAQALDLAPSAVSGLVQRMEALDWVRRRACPQDGRTQRVWLRPAGRDQLPAVRQGLQRLNARLCASFSDDELQVVARWLQQVRALRPQPESSDATPD